MCDSKDIKQRTCLKSSANSERSESMPDEIPAAGKFDMTDCFWQELFITVIFGQEGLFDFQLGVRLSQRVEKTSHIKSCLQKH